jgi:hypothetical protein
MDKIFVFVVAWFALTVMVLVAYGMLRLLAFLVRGIVLVVADDLRRIIGRL